MTASPRSAQSGPPEPLVVGVRRDGSLVRVPPYQPIMVVVGQPRTGKTRGVAIPVIAQWQRRLLAASVRNDIVLGTIHARARYGPVKVLDPAGIAGADLPVTGIRFLASCEQWQGAMRVAHHLTDTVAASAGLQEAGFWYLLSRKIIAPSLFAAALGGLSIRDVLRWVKTREEFEIRAILDDRGARVRRGRRLFTEDPWGGPESIDDMWESSEDQSETAEPDTDRALALTMIESIWDLEERAKQSAFATADVALSGFEVPSLAATVDGDLDLGEFFEQEGASLYIVAPTVDQHLFAPFITTVFDMVLSPIAQCAETSGRPADLLVLLDEAGGIGHIPDFERRTATAAGDGLTFVSLWHSPGQLRMLYGDTAAASVIANHHALLALPGVDAHAAQLIDERVGEDAGDSLPPGRGVTRLRRIAPGHAIVVMGRDDPEQIRLLTPEVDPLLRLELGW